MAPRDLAAALAAHPFLAGVDHGHVEQLADAAGERTWPAGAWLFRHGGVADVFHLVVAGRVALEVADPGHDSIIVETLRPGEPLGWSWLFPHRTWAFDARAVEDTTTLELDAGRLRALMDEDAEFGRDFALRVGRVAVDRLLHTRTQLVLAHHHARR